MSLRLKQGFKKLYWVLLVIWYQLECVIAPRPAIHLAVLKPRQGLRAAKPIEKSLQVEQVNRDRQNWIAKKKAIQKSSQDHSVRERALHTHREQFPHSKHEPSTFSIITPIKEGAYIKKSWKPINTQQRWEFFEKSWTLINEVLERTAASEDMERKDWVSIVVGVDRLTFFLESLSQQEHEQLNCLENIFADSKSLLSFLKDGMIQRHVDAQLATFDQIKKIVTRLEAKEEEIQRPNLQNQQREKLLQELERELAVIDPFTKRRINQLTDKNFELLAFQVRFQKLSSIERSKIVRFMDLYTKLLSQLEGMSHQQKVKHYGQLKDLLHDLQPQSRFLLNDHPNIDVKAVLHTTYKATYLGLRQKLFKTADLEQKKDILWDILLLMDQKWIEYEPIPIKQTENWQKIRQSLLVALNRATDMFNPRKRLEQTTAIPIYSATKAALEERRLFLQGYSKGQLKKQSFYWLHDSWFVGLDSTTRGQETPCSVQQEMAIDFVSNLAHYVLEYFQLKQGNADKLLVDLNRVASLKQLTKLSQAMSQKWEKRLGLSLKRIIDGLATDRLQLTAQETKKIELLSEISSGELALRPGTFTTESSNLIVLDNYKKALNSEKGSQIRLYLESIIDGKPQNIPYPSMLKLQRLNSKAFEKVHKEIDRLASWKTMPKSELQLDLALLPYSAQCMLLEDFYFKDMKIKLQSPLAKKLFSLGMSNAPYSARDISDLSLLKEELQSKPTKTKTEQRALKYITESIKKSVNLRQMKRFELTTTLVRADLNKAFIEMYQAPRIRSTALKAFGEVIERAKALEFGLDEEEEAFLEQADIFLQNQDQLSAIQKQKAYMHSYFELLRNRYKKVFQDETAVNYIVRCNLMEKYQKLKNEGISLQLFKSKSKLESLISQERNKVLKGSSKKIRDVQQSLQMEAISILSQFSLKMSQSLTGKHVLEDYKQFKEMKLYQLEMGIKNALKNRQMPPHYKSYDIYGKLSRAFIESNGVQKHSNQLKSLHEVLDAMKEIPLQQRRSLTARMYSKWIDVIVCHQKVLEAQGKPNDFVFNLDNDSQIELTVQLFGASQNQQVSLLIRSINQMQQKKSILNYVTAQKLMKIQGKLMKGEISFHSARMLSTVQIVRDLLTDSKNINQLRKLLQALPTNVRHIIEEAFSIDLLNLEKSYESLKEVYKRENMPEQVYRYNPKASRDIFIMEGIVNKVLQSSNLLQDADIQIHSKLPAVEGNQDSDAYADWQNHQCQRIWKLLNLCGIYKSPMTDNSKITIQQVERQYLIPQTIGDQREYAYFIVGRDIIN